MENENITAFAFKTGRLIEKYIEEHTENLSYQNKMLQAKVLDLYVKLVREFGEDNIICIKYAKNFDIDIKYEGKI